MPRTIGYLASPWPRGTMFENDHLDRIVQQIIPAQVPAGHKNAVVFTEDLTGLKVAALFTLGAGQHWQFEEAYTHKWSGENELSAREVVSW